MNREHRLQYCEVCTNRKMDFKKGLVCGKTNEQATFINTCEDYEVDSAQKTMVDQSRAVRKQQENEEETLGLSKFGIKNPVTAGWIIIIGSAAWFVLGLHFLNRIFFWPLILLIVGFVILSRATKRLKESKPIDDNVIDGDL